MDEKDIQQFMRDSVQQMHELTGIVEERLTEKYGEAFTAQKLRINEGDQSIVWTVIPKNKPSLLFYARFSEKGEMTDTYVSRCFMHELEGMISNVLGSGGLRSMVRALPDSEEGNRADLALPLNDYLSIRRVKWIHLAGVIETGNESVEQAVSVLKQICEPLGTEVTVDLRGCDTESYQAYNSIFAENINVSTALLDRNEANNRFFGQIVQHRETNKELI